MKTILKVFKIHFTSIIFLFLSFLCGYFKQSLFIFTIVIIHELGHVFFIKLFKYPIISITIYPFGGVTKVNKKINSSIYADLIISMGGIFLQIILYIILINQTYLSVYDTNFLLFYNKIIFFFNLIPIIPLDGAIFLKGILELFMPYEKTEVVIQNISLFIFLLFLFCNYYYKLNNYYICGVLMYQMITYKQKVKYLLNRFYLERYLYSFRYQNIINESSLNYHLLRKNTKHFFYNGKYYIDEKAVLKSHFYDFSCQSK